jgi:hypothetical protein
MFGSVCNAALHFIAWVTSEILATRPKRQLVAMFRACSYDTYTTGSLSPWCTLLGADGMEVIEYRDGM